jgi:hypothetical protein
MGKLKTIMELFEGRHFDRDVIILCVRWYLRFKLSLRDQALSEPLTNLADDSGSAYACFTLAVETTPIGGARLAEQSKTRPSARHNPLEIMRVLPIPGA